MARIGDLKLQTTESTSHVIPPLLSGSVLVLGVILIGAGLYQVSGAIDATVSAFLAAQPFLSDLSAKQQATARDLAARKFAPVDHAHFVATENVTDRLKGASQVLLGRYGKNRTGDDGPRRLPRWPAGKAAARTDERTGASRAVGIETTFASFASARVASGLGYRRRHQQLDASAGEGGFAGLAARQGGEATFLRNAVALPCARLG